MRHHIMILAGLLGLALAGAPATAQVSFDPRALSTLQPPSAAPTPATPAPAAAAAGGSTTSSSTPGHPASTEAARRRPERTPAPQRATRARHPAPAKTEAARPEAAKPGAAKAGAAKAGAAKPEAAKPGAAKSEPAKPGTLATTPAARGAGGTPPHPTDSRNATIPKAPPLPVALPPPPLVVPARPPPPPAPVSVLPTAPGQALPIAGGERITFGPGQSDLNPATDAAIKALMHAAPPSDATTFTVAAYAQGTPEDPSTARRLSLSRALAVRSVLITEGVASVRIYVKALGPPSAAVPQSQDGPPDRVDITVAGGPPPAAPKPP